MIKKDLLHLQVIMVMIVGFGGLVLMEQKV